ncbi:hypothetical protein [Azospirillum doebereinerae]
MFKPSILSTVILGALVVTTSTASKPVMPPRPCPPMFCKPGPPLPIPPHVPKPLPY